MPNEDGAKDLSEKMKSYSSSKKNSGKIIAIVGSPATGKTTLASKLGEYFNASIIYEQPEKGFPSYIKTNLKKMSNLFQTITWFRNRQVSNYKKALELRKKNKIIVLDTPFYQNQLFVDYYIKDKNEKRILRKMGDWDFSFIEQPDTTIYIKANTKTVNAFLNKRRGEREWETKEWNKFISKIPPFVEDYLNQTKYKIPNLIEINRMEYDFEKEKDFNKLLKLIERTWNPKIRELN